MNYPRSLLTYRLALGSKRAALPNDSIWAVTFSDLVTLLLCFFLTMVSFGPIGQAQREHDGPDSTAELPPGEQVKDGTGLAILGDGVERRVFELTREELSRMAQGGTSETLNEVKKIIESDGYDNRRVTITVSPEAQNEWQGERWLSIIQRLSGMQRQVFDAQPKTLLKLRISEPYPAVGRRVGENGRQDTIPVLIEIEDVSRSHG